MSIPPACGQSVESRMASRCRSTPWPLRFVTGACFGTRMTPGFSRRKSWIPSITLFHRGAEHEKGEGGALALPADRCPARIAILLRELCRAFAERLLLTVRIALLRRGAIVASMIWPIIARKPAARNASSNLWNKVSSRLLLHHERQRHGRAGRHREPAHLDDRIADQSKNPCRLPPALPLNKNKPSNRYVSLH
jgi:hypothetical protein